MEFVAPEYRIGTTGFAYADWRGGFYPEAVKPGEFLASYATAFDTLELDTTVYGVPPKVRVEKWAAAVGEGFLFCPKVPRAITHDRPIAEGLGLMREFLDALSPMREAGKLGPVLIQFPPAFGAEHAGDLERFLAGLPRDVRFAAEFRHASWQTPETAEMLARQRCAWVAADFAVDPWPIRVTADFLYVRFMGIRSSFRRYDRERLDRTERLRWWVKEISETCLLAQERPEGAARVGEVYAMFADDYAGHAPGTANRFRELLGMLARLPVAERRAQGVLF